MASLRFRFRRAADFTALRLGRAVLGYLVLVTAIITLAPFRFELAPAHGLTTIWSWSDLVMNVLMFVPFGFVYQLTRPRGAPPDWPRVVLLGAAVSGAIEIAQLFSPDRYTSLLDLLTNCTGAALGSWLFARLSDRLDGENAVKTLALELPLMGLVYQLVPLCWLIGLGSEGGPRRILLLPIAATAGAILGSVHAAYIARSLQRDRMWLVGMTLGWVLVAVVPGARGDIDLITACTALAMGVALLRSIATLRDREFHATRRFELPTLRFILPLVIAYLLASSMWGADEWPVFGESWHYTLALTSLTTALTQPLVYRALEHVAAFTMVGYIAAEFYGRRSRALRDTAPRVLIICSGLSLLLEIGRGFVPQYGASLLMWLFTTAAALFGGWLYLLQRDHVRALVARRKLLAAMHAARVQVNQPATAAGMSGHGRRRATPFPGWSRR